MGIRFKDLSLPLQVLVILGWIDVLYIFGLFTLGFILGALGL